MTKELARTLLRNFCKEKTEYGHELPIYDEVVTRTYSNGILNTWTFKGLLQYVYELEDKEMQKKQLLDFGSKVAMKAHSGQSGWSIEQLYNEMFEK